MSEEEIQQLLADLKKLAAPDCLLCAHNTEEGIDACEDIGYDCDACLRPCPCRTCGEANGHAGWEWQGLEGCDARGD